MNLNQINKIEKGSVNNIDNRGVGNTAIDNRKDKKDGILSKIKLFFKWIFT